MPSLPMLKIPPPSDSQEFEHILMDYSEAKYNGAATLLGRKGQAQHGIDIVVTRADMSYVCVQCKDYTMTPITEVKIDQWIAEAEASPIPMVQFVMVLGCSRDAKIQEHVFQVSHERIQQHQFPVELVFWDDIVHFLILHEELLCCYYPMYAAGNQVLTEQAAPKQEAKYPELIKNEKELRNLFFNELVKYHIQEFMDVDPFAGYPFRFVMDYDSFEVSIQQLLYKAVTIRESNRYIQIQNFLEAISMFVSYMSTMMELSNQGDRVQIRNPYVWQEIDKHKKKVDTYRENAYRYLEELSKC